MKKILLVLILPFITVAKQSAENKSGGNNFTFNRGPREDARQLIESYRQRALGGESMSDLAVRYSEDPGSAPDGGLYKDIAKGMMVKEFEAVAFSLKVGEISKVFETQYGLHFIQLVARHGALVDVRQILVIPK